MYRLALQLKRYRLAEKLRVCIFFLDMYFRMVMPVSIDYAYLADHWVATPSIPLLGLLQTRRVRVLY